MVSDDDAIHGRERELACFDEVVAEVAGGGRRTLVVCGSAGIGKTTLVDALVRRACAAGLQPLEGHCLDIDAAVPLGPVSQALADLPRGPAARQRGPASAADPLPVGTVGTVGMSNESPFDQLRAELTRAARRRPVLARDRACDGPGDRALRRFRLRGACDGVAGGGEGAPPAR